MSVEFGLVAGEAPLSELEAAEQVIDKDPHARAGFSIRETETLPNDIREVGDTLRIPPWQEEAFVPACQGDEESSLPRRSSTASARAWLVDNRGGPGRSLRK